MCASAQAYLQQDSSSWEDGPQKKAELRRSLLGMRLEKMKSSCFASFST